LAKTDHTGSSDQAGGSGNRARNTVALLEQETPDFIPPTLWPPNSPAPNPVLDYSIWIVLQEVYHSRIITDVENSKHVWVVWSTSGRSLTSWSIIDAAVGQWRHRLHACVSARRAHFEH